MIRKILKASLLVPGISTLLLTVSYAAPTAPEIKNPLGFGTIAGLVNRASGFIQPLALIALVACIIAAGFIRLTSAGDSEKEQKSVKILVSAAIGFFIIVLAPLLVRIIGSILGVDSTLLNI